jgi:hypothetical protein
VRPDTTLGQGLIELMRGLSLGIPIACYACDDNEENAIVLVVR